MLVLLGSGPLITGVNQFPVLTLSSALICQPRAQLAFAERQFVERLIHPLMAGHGVDIAAIAAAVVRVFDACC